jgi:hypothetical protein
VPRAVDYPTEWTSTNQLGWSKPKLVYELQQELLEYRTYPPDITFDWFDPTIEQSRLDMAASTVMVIDGVYAFDNNFGIEQRIIGIEVRYPPPLPPPPPVADAAEPVEVPAAVPADVVKEAVESPTDDEPLVDLPAAPVRRGRAKTAGWQRAVSILKKIFPDAMPAKEATSDADIIVTIKTEWKVVLNPLHVKLPSDNTLRAVIKEQRAARSVS